MVFKRTLHRDDHRYDVIFLPPRGEWQAWEYGPNDRLLGIAHLPPKVAFRSTEPDYSSLDFRALRYTRGTDYLTAMTITRNRHGI